MFETLTITTILLVLFFAYQNVKWGLTSAIPKDDDARLRFYCSECLTALKNLLAGARLKRLEPDSLYLADDRRLYVDEGKVRLGDSQLANLGPRGQLSFERLSETGLMVSIQAQEVEKSHRIAVRLEVEFVEPAAVG
ncbi:MAG: hypothetical protein U0931_23330 [Vulcanimicrobiota bacterium]